MTRRGLAMLFAAATQSKAALDPVDTANRFVRVWSEWAAVANARPAGTISVHEYEMWQRVCIEFRATEAKIGPMYRGK